MSYEIKDFMDDIDKVEKKTGKAVLRRCTLCGGEIHKMNPWGYNHMGAGVISVLGFCEGSPEECEKRETGYTYQGYVDGVNCFMFVMPEDPVYLAKKLYIHLTDCHRGWKWKKEGKMEKWAAKKLKGWKYLPPVEIETQIT